MIRPFVKAPVLFCLQVGFVTQHAYSAMMNDSQDTLSLWTLFRYLHIIYKCQLIGTLPAVTSLRALLKTNGRLLIYLHVALYSVVCICDGGGDERRASELYEQSKVVACCFFACMNMMLSRQLTNVVPQVCESSRTLISI